MALTLRVTDIEKYYDGKPALKGCSYSFDSTGIYALMGPNGSGKSTFLRVCALLEPPDTGGVSYSSSGEIVKNDIQLRRRITAVLPKVGVFNTTVFKNAAYGLNIRGVEGKIIEEKTAEALRSVGLFQKAKQNALTLSSGETQRLGIARAMVAGPEILFLDEPTASIDEENTGIVEEIILNLKKEGKTTLIITTHDRDQAERLADMILLLHEGRIAGVQPAGGGVSR